MNGERVGTWAQTTAGVDQFSYDESWLASPRVRPLSITLPFLPGNEDHRGEHVTTWFANLLPDSGEILKRIASRFRVATDARSLLAEIGRDCVGAVQILPADEEPNERGSLEKDELTVADVARTLRSVTSSAALHFDDEPFRISVAGAQEKTALLRLDNHWYRPGRTTPTTHILKLPLGLVGNMRFNLEDSVANEWVCLRFLRALGFDVANAEMAAFHDDVSTERVLIVERFDRQWTNDQRDIIRIPQEDFCQATATAPSKKYESDGGPGIADIVRILRSGINPEEDIRTFVLSQLAFWLLAAIDGHAKNFSLFLRRDGYTLTPLYDVISAWPIIGHGPTQLPIQKATLAMAVRCKHKHYDIDRIGSRHWRCLADQTQVPFAELQHLVQRVPAAIAETESDLPADFPEWVWGAIADGLRRNAERFSSLSHTLLASHPT